MVTAWNFFCFRIVSSFNILKTLTPLVNAGLFGCFHNPSNTDMNYRTFNMRMCSFCMRIYTRRTSVYGLIRTFVESAQALTPEKSQGPRKAQHVTVIHPFGDHAPSCLTFAFEREYLLCATDSPKKNREEVGGRSVCVGGGGMLVVSCIKVKGDESLLMLQ